jgi:glycosyltransferase involved in cell wall biosynthesis
MPTAEMVSRGENSPDRPDRRQPELVRASSLGGGAIDFSIVVPAHNRPQQLSQCLQAIARLAYPVLCYEVVVVDDGSAASLEPVVLPLLGRLNITLLRQSNAGPAGARNAGAAAARGRYVVFTDDDCRPDPGWLDALASRLAANPCCAAGGRTLNGLAGNLFSSASQLLLEYLYRHWNRDENEAFFIASSNLAFPRARFIELEGFDPSFPLAAGEDRELCHRWRLRNGRIVYAPDAIIRHFHALNLKGFLIQHFNYGRGALIFHDLKRRRAEPDVPVQPESFYFPLLKYAFTRDRGLRGVALAMLVGLSQIVMPLGYLRQLFLARRNSRVIGTLTGRDDGDPARGARAEPARRR